ncbi:hypothetical protein GALMADRAFT_418286 [Galerina marginata CBS 339.88]|uniref:F-box domain-containing protein n=1 Tax=Galerina marginata (strain CBS 339.88) TaxID=685588 RepID=A0A067T139_GALM3|nr:hypothetical protein GALMADRAFT_418286 [Galerina marginata CBS 339.88]
MLLSSDLDSLVPKETKVFTQRLPNVLYLSLTDHLENLTKLSFPWSCTLASFQGWLHSFVAHQMHHCFQIQEILVIIFEFVVSNVENNKATLDRQSIVALLKTCRTFNGPAVQILWRELYTPVPLLLTMPDDLLELEKIDKEKYSYFGRPRTLTFKRDVVPSDWERFDVYAPFVKKLGVMGRNERLLVSYTVVDDNVCRALEQRKSVLLPALTSITSATNDLAYIGLFLTPLVLRLKLTMRSRQLELLTSLAADIPFRAPMLKILHLTESHTWKEEEITLFGPALHQLLANLDLEELDCEWFPLPGETAQVLFGMPSLRVVNIRRALPGLVQDLQSNPLKQPQLTEFKLSTDVLGSDGLAELVPLLLPSKLIVFSVTSSITISISAEENITDFILAIAAHCSPTTFTDLTFEPNPKGGQQDQVPELGPTAVTFAMLRPLLPFCNLRELRLNAQPLDFADDEVKQMAMAWPRLEGLYFDTSYGHPSPRPSLKSLLWLAAYCKRLVSLEFEFSEFPGDSGEASPEEMALAVDHNLKFLSVGASMIENPARVAGFLNCVFPNLALLMSTDLRPIDGQDLHPNNERWKEVQAQIQRVD